jgi:hypothetical protein
MDFNNQGLMKEREDTIPIPTSKTEENTKKIKIDGETQSHYPRGEISHPLSLSLCRIQS